MNMLTPLMICLKVGGVDNIVRERPFCATEIEYQVMKRRRWETFNSFSASFSHHEKKPCVIEKETLGKISIEYSLFFLFTFLIG